MLIFCCIPDRAERYDDRRTLKMSGVTEGNELHDFSLSGNGDSGERCCRKNEGRNKPIHELSGWNSGIICYNMTKVT